MKSIISVLLFALLVGCAGSKGTSTKAPTPESKQKGPKPYAKVITKEATSDSGVFIVHQVKEKWYYEIPGQELGKDFLLVTTQARTQSGVGYGGDYINIQVVRWERANDRVLLRAVLYGSVASDSLPIHYAVEKANFPPILKAFDIQTFNHDSSAVVIEMTDLFTTDMTEFGLGRRARERFKIKRLDSKRSFVDTIKTFPENVETAVTLTYDAGEVPLDNMLSTISIQMHHSMVKLPEKLMMPRLDDDRVGFFSVKQYDYGYDAQRAERRRYISRWRLEPADTAAFQRGELTEPVKPIVFYIDRGVPDKWRPWLKEGVESWRVAFQKAGFKNAIIAKDPPSREEDPDWSSEDARYSTIRWLPSWIQNAYGPSITDPRTGEILDADIGFFHNVMNLMRNWYYVQAGAVDQRAQKLPLPDSLMGELLQYIAAHEVGHSLGFQHNMKATSQYPVDSLRSRTFTQKYGTEASIMDYGRFNYVAQPGDGAYTIPRIGPYDIFAVEWGYKPILGAESPDEEKGVLNAIAARQEEEPYLRFGSADGIDPTAQTEDLGHDPVAATRYGLMNIRRISDALVSATTVDGEDYSTLREIYGSLVAQRNRELRHVANVVGGVVKSERIAGQEGMVYHPVPREAQREAMAFLAEEGFTTPTEILNPEILALIEPTGAAERVLQGHRSLLTTIMSNRRIARLVNQAELPYGGEKPYRLSEMLTDLRKGVWSELAARSVEADLYRRNLQRAYLDVMDGKLNPQALQRPPNSLPGEARALIRSELMQLDKSIAKAIPAAKSREMHAHLLDCRHQISLILYPEKK